MGGCGSASEVERLDDAGFYGDDAVLILQNAVDDEKRVVHDDGVVFFEKLRRDDDVGDAGFVFEAEENKAFGRSRTLANDDRAGYANERRRREVRRAVRAGETPL